MLNATLEGMNDYNGKTSDYSCSGNPHQVVIQGGRIKNVVAL